MIFVHKFRCACLATALLLCGCAASQLGISTSQMVQRITDIRERQVLSNISAAIDDHDAVPSEVLLGTGQSTVGVGATPTLKLPDLNLSTTTKEFDLGVADTWTAQWTFTPVTDSDDLRRLRNIFALIVSTDAQYDTLPKKNSKPPVHGPSTSNGKVANWEEVMNYVVKGDSIDCQLYQREHRPPATASGVPFARWLYWRAANGDWYPKRLEPALPIVSLGKYGNWEIGITSRACFDDFVILVQQATPVAAHINSLGTPNMLQLPPAP